MRNFFRIALTTLVLAGTLAAAAYPAASAMLTGDGSDPIPACYPTEPNCGPPIPDPTPPAPKLPSAR